MLVMALVQVARVETHISMVMVSRSMLMEVDQVEVELEDRVEVALDIMVQKVEDRQILVVALLDVVVFHFMEMVEVQEIE